MCKSRVPQQSGFVINGWQNGVQIFMELISAGVVHRLVIRKTVLLVVADGIVVVVRPSTIHLNPRPSIFSCTYFGKTWLLNCFIALASLCVSNRGWSSGCQQWDFCCYLRIKSKSAWHFFAIHKCIHTNSWELQKVNWIDWTYRRWFDGNESEP